MNRAGIAAALVALIVAGLGQPAVAAAVAAPVLTDVRPGSGPVRGSTVTLVGANLTPDAVVRFGGVAGTEVRVEADGERLTVRAPARPAGFVDVSVTTAGGSDTVIRGYRYLGGVTVSRVTPAAGPTAGGTTVTVLGSGFTGDSLVTFGNKPSLSVQANLEGTELTALLPAHAAGPVDVRVATAGGSAVRPDGFEYVVAPSLLAVAPDAGVAAGGTRVTLTGTALRPGMTVTFGDTPAEVRSVSADRTTALVLAPAHAPGRVAVAVTTPGGTATLDASYTYLAVPVLTAVAPDTGPAAGGQRVTLSGSGFAPGMTVRFAGAPATAVDVVSPTSASATTPARPAGPVAVSVSTAGGSASLEAAYTHLAGPTVGSLTPDVGPTGGGTTVTLTGTGLRPGLRVELGGEAAAVLSVEPDGTSVSVLTPAHPPGRVAVAVTTTGGTTTRPNAFTYAGVPTLTDVAPASGPATGGTAARLTGTGLVAGMQVRLGGTLATVVSVNPAGTAAVVTTPARAPGVVDVSVTTTGGVTSLPGGFEYVVAPELDSLTPDVGPTSGGRQIRLAGSGFRPGMVVRLGSTLATLDAVNPAGTSATVTTPARPAGTVAVTVATPGGTATLGAAYTFVAAPVLTAVVPAAGPIDGGQRVALRGSSFRDGMLVAFDAVPATGLVVESATRATVLTPAHDPGVVAVAVASPGGASTLPDAFEYVAAPVLTTVTPAAGPTAGGQVATLTGAGLRPDMQVRFGSTEATVLAVDPDGRSASVATPARTPATVAVVVATPGGSATLAGAYTYVAAPTLTAVAPAVGATSGGETITLRGSAFRDGMTVSLGGQPATGLVVESATRARVVVPAGAPGPVDVTVATAGGSASLAAAYTYVAAPDLTAIDPVAGPTTGGQVATLTGLGLRPDMQVRFGTGTATVLAVAADGSTATVTTPARSPGPVGVSVTTAGGSATLADAYTYVAAPVLTSVAPATGSTAGGQTVVLRGSGLREGMAVTFDDVPATGLVVTSATRATVVTPAHDPGAVDVAVATAGGSATLPGSYEYLPSIGASGLP